jgi:hypothetical protein
MKRGAGEEQQDEEAAAAKRFKVEQGPSNDAADVTDEAKYSKTDVQGQAAATAAKQEPLQEQQDADQESSDEDDAPIQLPVSTTRSAVRKGHECPYLDTILRQVGAAVDDALPPAAACSSAALY